MELIYLQDPGHGWLKVDRAIASDLGISEHITPYSYVEGPSIWLEEDCDAGLLIKALKARGIAYTIKEKHVNGDAYVRSLPRYTEGRTHG
jgi:hypothetical protein